MALVAQRIVELEEEGVDAGAFVPEGNRFHRIRKDVLYDERVVNVEGSRVRDGEASGWRNWEKVREQIPF